MACGCKNSSANRQPAAVKQVVKRTNYSYGSNASPARQTVVNKASIIKRRAVIRRPI